MICQKLNEIFYSGVLLKHAHTFSVKKIFYPLNVFLVPVDSCFVSMLTDRVLDRGKRFVSESFFCCNSMAIEDDDDDVGKSEVR